MAFLVRRPGERFEIRETVSTDRGPRARTLASFRGVLTDRLLTSAAARAELAFDVEEVRERARALGIPVRAGLHPEARALLARLKRGDPPDPLLVGLLVEALASAAVEPVSAERAEVAEWLGAGDAERGEALRGLLRVTDRIRSSREPVRERSEPRFPHFRTKRRRRRAA